MALLNQAKIALATAGFKALFLKGLENSAANEVISKIAMTVLSKNSSETYGWLEDTGPMREFVGEAVINKFSAEAYTIPNKAWEKTVEVLIADIERDSEGLYAPAISEMARAANDHDGTKLADLICNGFTRKCYDGQNFFASAHKYSSGLTYSNVMTKKLSAVNFRTARSTLRTMRRADGTSLGLGKEFVLIVGASNEALAREILLAERSSNGATNIDRDSAKPIIWSEIDTINPNAWFLVEAGLSIKSFVIQKEVAPVLRKLDNPNSEHAIKNDTFLYQAYKRSGYGYGLPQLIVGSDGTAAA